MYRTALESIIYTCTEQLWSLESYVPVQKALESYIYTCTEQLWSQEYNLHVQNSSGVNYIYLYRIALESGVLCICTEQPLSPIYSFTEQLWSLDSYIPV